MHPKIVQLAGEAAGKADIVLFSISMGASLPLVVRAWIEVELGRSAGHSRGLLALVETGAARGRHPSPVWLFLRDVARRSGWDFLAHSPVPTVISHDCIRE